MDNTQLDFNRYKIIFDYLSLGFALKNYEKGRSLFYRDNSYYVEVESKGVFCKINEKKFATIVDSLSINKIKNCFVDGRVESYHNKLNNMTAEFNPMDFEQTK